MVNHGKTQSATKPEKIRADEHSVWVHTNVRPITVPGGDSDEEAWEYDMAQYALGEWVEFLSKELFDGQMEKQLEAWSHGAPCRMTGRKPNGRKGYGQEEAKPD